jgi:histidine triad (HIT) family protein
LSASPFWSAPLGFKLDVALTLLRHKLSRRLWNRTMAYDPNNIFAKILRGELPCHKVYEDDKAFAFLDIMPRAPGHTLVLPKSAARNLLDVAPEDLAHVARVTQKIAKAAIKVFDADGVTIQQFNEPAGGQVVFHLHVHVIPRKDGVPMKPPASVKAEPSVLSDQALKLAAALKD